jgi:hypothetical protein
VRNAAMLAATGPEPLSVFLRRHRLKATRGVVFTLRRVRRRRERHVRLRTAKKARYHVTVAAVAANQTMWADVPDIARSSYWIAGSFRGLLFVRTDRILLSGCEEFTKLVVREAEGFKTEVRDEVLRAGGAAHRHPTGVQCELVVSDDVGALLHFAEVIQNDHRNLFEPQLPGGEKTPVAGNHACLGVHQNRVVKAEFRDAGCDLCNLGVRVRSRIFGSIYRVTRVRYA